MLFKNKLPKSLSRLFASQEWLHLDIGDFNIGWMSVEYWYWWYRPSYQQYCPVVWLSIDDIDIGWISVGYLLDIGDIGDIYPHINGLVSQLGRAAGNWTSTSYALALQEEYEDEE